MHGDADVAMRLTLTPPSSDIGAPAPSWRAAVGDRFLATLLASAVPAMSMPIPANVVREFWCLMASDDFASVAAVLAPDFVLDWPQSNERIRGAGRFTQMNAEYPAQGPWRFTVNRLVGGDSEVVTDVTVTDGTQTARAISFFTVAAGMITHIVEFWPEPYPAPVNRKHLVEAIA